LRAGAGWLGSSTSFRSFDVESQTVSLNDPELDASAQTAIKDGYDTALLSSGSAICQLKSAARQLMPQYDPMLDPQFFLASLSREWKPRVIVVRSGSDIVGIVYAKERAVWGIPTGIVRIDQTLHNSLLRGCGNHEQDILSLALVKLVSSRRILSVQLKIPFAWSDPSSFSEPFSSRPIEIQFSRLRDHHAHFPLPRTYDDFLKLLGSTSRHNFRYYRRRFEAAGHRYVPKLSLDTLRSVAWELKEKCSLPAQSRTIESFLNMVATSETPLAVGLQHVNGQWLSVAAGCYRPGQAVIFFQLNSDQEFARSSLSVVLRSYLIDGLIQAGCPELVILGGTTPPLSRYATHPRTVNMHVDKLIYSWRAVRFFSRIMGPHLPKQFSGYALRYAKQELPDHN
jgi:hypothetical protein